MFGKRATTGTLGGSPLSVHQFRNPPKTIRAITPNTIVQLGSQSTTTDSSPSHMNSVSVLKDQRPYAEVYLFHQPFRGLLDSGSAVTVKRWCPLVQEHAGDLKPSKLALSAANSSTLAILGEMIIPITFREKTIDLQVVIVEQLAQELILGFDFWEVMRIRIEVMAVKPSFEFQVTTEIDLDEPSRQACQSAVERFLITTKEFLGRTHVLKHRIELKEEAQPFLVRSHLCPDTTSENDRGIRRHVTAEGHLSK